jgi:hypothetical protein
MASVIFQRPQEHSSTRTAMLPALACCCRPRLAGTARNSAHSADRNSDGAKIRQHDKRNRPKRNGPGAGEPGPSQSGLPMPRGSACSLSTRRREDRSRHVMVIPRLNGAQAFAATVLDRNLDPPARSATRAGRSPRLPTPQNPAAVLWRSRSGRRSIRRGARSASKPEEPRRPR